MNSDYVLKLERRLAELEERLRKMESNQTLKSSGQTVTLDGNVVIGGKVDVSSGNYVAALTDGNTGGFVAGASSDVLWYRSAVNTWRTPDNVDIDGTLTVGGTSPVVGTGTTGYVARWSGTNTITTGLLTDDGSIFAVAGALAQAKTTLNGGSWNYTPGATAITNAAIYGTIGDNGVIADLATTFIFPQYTADYSSLGYGIRFFAASNAGAGTMSAYYGIYMATSTPAMTNWGIYLESNAIYSGGKIDVASGNYVSALTDGNTGGFVAGASSDVLWYRSAVDTWRTPDNVVIDGKVGIGTTAPASRLDIAAGAMTLNEMTAPAAPAANSVVVYAVDNGAGKTKLMALFNTGAAQQLAIQP